VELLPVKTATPQQCALLALAYSRKGDRARAREWLERLREPDTPASASSGTSPTQSDLEVALLRREAESEAEAEMQVLDDPDFPSDPFAR
jgi:hypothetical protein